MSDEEVGARGDAAPAFEVSLTGRGGRSERGRSGRALSCAFGGRGGRGGRGEERVDRRLSCKVSCKRAFCASLKSRRERRGMWADEQL